MDAQKGARSAFFTETFLENLTLPVALKTVLESFAHLEQAFQPV